MYRDDERVVILRKLNWNILVKRLASKYNQTIMLSSGSISALFVNEGFVLLKNMTLIKVI